MRNQRALAAACAALAVLGFAAPVAVADGMGNGGGSSNDTGVNVGSGTGNGLGGLNGTGHFDGHFNNNGNGSLSSNGRDTLGRGEDFGRGEDPEDEDEDFGRGDEFGRGGDFGARGDGGLRNIVSEPRVIAAGGRLLATVDGCRGGVMSSRAFRTTSLTPLRNDVSRGAVTIDPGTRPGPYDITVECNGRRLTRPGAFTVLGGVNGGFGGSVTSGATPADTAIGGGLVGSVVIAGGVYWLGRRNEKRI
ncbi:hypothetical protein [Streptomyces sp. NPDC002676]